VSWFSSSRLRAEKLLLEARDALEVRVAERTGELTTANQALQQAQDELSELTHKLAQENLYLEDEIRSDAKFKEIVGKSHELRRVLKLVETVAPTDSTALIYGETGTGKELIARAIHDFSSRHSRTFVKLNCAAIPAGLLESELFGHERGAFTGAFAQRIGRLELANNGTRFWTRSATFHPSFSRSYCECCRNVNLNDWGVHEPLRPMYVLLPQPIEI
jgi:transcriptional regulator with GAF, ATPase, and Fis domain